MVCTPPTITVGGVVLSTSDFQNSKELFDKVSGGGADPSLDEYTESVAGGNNSAGKSGILIPSKPDSEIPEQTSLPPAISEQSSQSDNKAPSGKNGTTVACSIWDGQNYDAKLSPNFKLRQFTINTLGPYRLIDYGGFTVQQRFCNLQNLAHNIAEPLLAKFGSFNINSGLRNRSSGKNISQHIIGQAMDVQFNGWSYARYWENAQWVKDNIPYDQFIYEHSDKTGLAWFHLSFVAGGNRAPTLPTKVMTMYRNAFSPGLHRYG